MRTLTNPGSAIAARIDLVMAAKAAASKLSTATRDLDLLRKGGAQDVGEMRRAAEAKMLAEVQDIVANWKMVTMLESLTAAERAVLNEVTGTIV